MFEPLFKPIADENIRPCHNETKHYQDYLNNNYPAFLENSEQLQMEDVRGL